MRKFRNFLISFLCFIVFLSVEAADYYNQELITENLFLNEDFQQDCQYLHYKEALQAYGDFSGLNENDYQNLVGILPAYQKDLKEFIGSGLSPIAIINDGSGKAEQIMSHIVNETQVYEDIQNYSYFSGLNNYQNLGAWGAYEGNWKEVIGSYPNFIAITNGGGGGANQQIVSYIVSETPAYKVMQDYHSVADLSDQTIYFIKDESLYNNEIEENKKDYFGNSETLYQAITNGGGGGANQKAFLILMQNNQDFVLEQIQSLNEMNFRPEQIEENNCLIYKKF